MKMDNSWLNLVINDVTTLWPIITNQYTQDEFPNVPVPTSEIVRDYVLNKLVDERRQIRKRLFSYDASRHYLKPDIAPSNEPTLPCPQCEIMFRTKGIRALHLIKEHNVHPITYYYTNTPWCPVC